MSKPWTWWWWLGNAVDTTGLSYNLKNMQKAGFGGVSVTPIYGVKGYENQFINFLSPKWMHMFAFTVKKAHKLGMGVDMTTGTGWNFGGPNIKLKDAASEVFFQKYSLNSGQTLQRAIAMNNPREQGIAKLQKVMAYSSNGKKLNITQDVASNGHLDWTAPPGKWQIIAVFNGKTLQKVKRAAPGGKGYMMNFFSLGALKTYLKRFNHAFRGAKIAPYAFYNDSYEVHNADWSPHFFKEFFKKRKYHLQNYLPQLLGEGNPDTVSRVRADFRRTLSDMLLDNFTIPWVRWTHKMGSISRSQAHGSPGNLLDLYAATDIPETETFGKSKIHIDGTKVTAIDPLFIKFASSAAHISGNKYASSETFTWMIEHFRSRLSVAKPILDRVLLSGINHVFFHGAPYSPKGAPWPGWQFYASVNFTPYNPMWNDIPAFNKYITRSQSFLQSGKPDNDFLLYWPVQDLWYNLKKPLMVQLATNNQDQWLDPSSFYKTAKKMRKDGYSLDYISGRYLQRTTVKKGLLQTPGARYKALVVPPCRFMSVATLKAVLRLIQHGGKVIFLNHLPKNVPGLGNLAQRRQQYKKLVQKFPEGLSFSNNKKQRLGRGELITGSDLKKTLSLTGVPAEAMVNRGLKYERRKLPDGTAYFIKNPHTHKTVDGWVPLSVPATSAAIYAPYSGKKGVAKTRSANGHTQVYLQLHPGQALVVRTWSHKKISGHPWAYYETKARPIKVGGPWQFSFGQGWPSIPGHFRMHQLHSWTSLNDSARTFAGTGIYETHFKEPTTKAGNWLLKLGKVNYGAKVFLNGHKVGTLWALPFEARVGAYLKKGENTLKIEVSNSGANRIAQYDRTGRKWKKFYDINFVNMNYKPFDASGWKTVPSGLLGPVTLTPLKKKNF
ncbi:MAG TPA: glycosyl hydrolase [Balneolaceae bacterium]|nr:glycosyl hydrolase [Balneolaceae bacterium]